MRLERHLLVTATFFQRYYFMAGLVNNCSQPYWSGKAINKLSEEVTATRSACLGPYLTRIRRSSMCFINMHSMSIYDAKCALETRIDAGQPRLLKSSFAVLPLFILSPRPNHLMCSTTFSLILQRDV